MAPNGPQFEQTAQGEHDQKRKMMKDVQNIEHVCACVRVCFYQNLMFRIITYNSI